MAAQLRNSMTIFYNVSELSLLKDRYITPRTSLWTYKEYHNTFFYYTISFYIFF